MATYAELRALFNNSELKNKVEVATIISVNNLLSGTPTAADRKYAADVFRNPSSESQSVLMSVLAANDGLDASQISGASDSAIQNNVDTVIPNLVLARSDA